MKYWSVNTKLSRYFTCYACNTELGCRQLINLTAMIYSYQNSLFQVQLYASIPIMNHTELRLLALFIRILLVFRSAVLLRGPYFENVYYIRSNVTYFISFSLKKVCIQLPLYDLKAGRQSNTVTHNGRVVVYNNNNN